MIGAAIRLSNIYAAVIKKWIKKSIPFSIQPQLQDLLQDPLVFPALFLWAYKDVLPPSFAWNG